MLGSPILDVAIGMAFIYLLLSLIASAMPEYWNTLRRPSWDNLRSLLQAVLGWLITAFALSFGAPFWFDTLNRFMIVRGTIKPREKSTIEPSKD